MMLGENRRPNPAVHVPPWPNFDDDQMAEVYSPLKYNAGDNHFSNNSNPFYLQEALAALQPYLPSKEPDVESDSELSGLGNTDSPVDACSCDHFRMFEFKVRRCARGRSHDWTECPYAHPGEKARRRDPRKYHYSGTACPDFRKGNCRKGDACEFSHGVFECWLHPARYRTQPCKDGQGCRRRVCFFAHTPDQLRVVSSSDGSPSCAKTLTFWSSLVSGSLPVSPRVESSPPVSPIAQSLSRSLGLASINGMVASLRNLQFGEVKSLPSSLGAQLGCCSPPPGFGSSRGAVIRSGFCSLPSTPTRNWTHTGIGHLDFWDKLCEEEPETERVESGRNLRAKMFEKLSNENSLLRVDPGQ